MMSRATFLVILLLAPAVRAADSVPAAPAATAPAGRAIALPEAVGLAIARSEALAAGAAGVEEAEARITELRAAALPKLGLNGTWKFQDAPGDTADQRTGWVSLHQPLFSGFREFLLLRAGRELRGSASADLDRTRTLLALDVARAYTGLLRTRRAIAIRVGVRELTAQRVGDLEVRSRDGRSRASEVLSARATLARQDGELERLQGDDAAAGDRLGFLTGLAERLDPRPLDAPVLPALDPLLAAANDRADVKARRRDLAAAELAVVAARRERWPVLSADASYYLDRPAPSEDNRWDATLTAQLPLFAGGGIAARVRSAEAVRRGAAEHAALAERLAALDVRTAYRELDATLKSVTALTAAEELAGKNTAAQSDDYKNGLVTNLEVLGALNTLMEVRLELEDTRLDAALGAVALDAAAGKPVGGAR